MSLCEVISTTKKGFCTYKITAVYLITDDYLKPTQFKFCVFSINRSIKGWEIAT